MSAEIWEYLGFPNVTNETWADYHVQYLNPSAEFGSSGADPQRLSDWAETVRAIKQVNPASVVLMTYHTTEVWYKDLVRNNSGQQYLPLDCIMRNADGTPCDWWAPWPNGIITTNMFMPKCLAAVTTYAQRSLPALVAAGLDGVLLDGLVPFSEGCKSRQVDITAAARAATARCGVTVRAHTFIYICQLVHRMRLFVFRSIVRCAMGYWQALDATSSKTTTMRGGGVGGDIVLQVELDLSDQPL